MFSMNEPTNEENGPFLPSSTALVSVHQACHALWCCTDVPSVLPWLGALRVSLSRERLDSYDPSEVFLAIQGVVLRFRDVSLSSSHAADISRPAESSSHPNVSLPSNPPSDLSRMLLEKALSAAATLAHVCVGPAWSHQLDRRRVRHGPLGFGNNNNNNNNSCMPIIPEVLPAAMLRFAATTESCLVTDQVTLVVALCCPSATRGAGWNIPGVDDVIESMVMSWMALITSEKNDLSLVVNEDDEGSCLTLHVARACTDLIVAEWRPTISMSEELVGSLLVLLDRAAHALLVHGSSSVPVLPSIVIQSVDGIAALSSSRDGLTISTLRLTELVESAVRTSTQLVLIAMEQAATDEQQETQLFKAQTLACTQKIDGLLVHLLAQERLSSVVIDALFHIVNHVNPNSPLCQLSHESGRDRALVLRGTVAIRVVSMGIVCSRRGGVVFPPSVLACNVAVLASDSCFVRS
jgi:hypothetical protein